MTAVVLLVLLAGIVWIFIGGPASAEKLLGKQDLTPEEIRVVAAKLLTTEDTQLRERATAKLIEQGDRAVPVLCEIGRTTSDSLLHFAAFKILSRLDMKEATSLLEELSRSPDLEVRKKAILIAVGLHSPEAVQILIRSLQDEYVGIRSVAAGALGSKGAMEAVLPLKQALQDPNTGVRRHAARSLKDLTGQDFKSVAERSPD